MNQYRAAIVGLGFIGGGDQVSGDALGQRVSDLDGTHVEALTGHPQVRLVAGSSRDPGRRERFSARTGIHTYADWRQMLAKEQPDIVSVATYAPVHAEITLACVEAGVRAVYCEKPIATRPVDGHRMVQACREAGVLLVINHNRRFHHNFRRLRNEIGNGRLGELTSAALQWGSGRLGGVGTHMIDLLCMVTGQQVAAVSGTLDLSGRPDCRGPQFGDPGAWGILRLDHGLMVTVDAADYNAMPLRMTINGTLGRAISDGSAVQLASWDGQTEEWPRPVATRSSMDVAVGEIVRSLDGGAQFPYDPEEAARVFEAIAAFHVSHDQNGCWIHLPLAEEDQSREVLCA